MVPFDLHVLSTPPAFVLSQDQTLIFKSFILADFFSSADITLISESLESTLGLPPFRPFCRSSGLLPLLLALLFLLVSCIVFKVPAGLLKASPRRLRRVLLADSFCILPLPLPSCQPLSLKNFPSNRASSLSILPLPLYIALSALRFAPL